MRERDKVRLGAITVLSILGVCILILMPQSTVKAMQNKMTEEMTGALFHTFHFCSSNVAHNFPYIFLVGIVITAVYILIIVEKLRIKKIAQALNESKEKYLIATKNANFSVWELDINNRRIIQYEHSREVHGNMEVIENVPDSIIESGYVIGEDVERFREMYEKIFAGAPNAEGEFWVKTNGRSQRWYERITYTTIYDKQGKPIRAIGSSKDITMQKEIEKKYKEEVYYRTCVDTDVVASFHFNLTQNWCGDGHSDFEEILALQNSGTVDGFFEAEYANNVDWEMLDAYKEMFNRKNLLKEFF